MFETVPGLKDFSDVIIVIPGYEQYYQYQVMPFVGDWEANAALKVLYNNPTLQARYYYLDLPHDETNVIDSNLDWSNIVFVYYDPIQPSVEIVKRPEDMLLLSFHVPGYDPGKRIINQSSKSVAYRRLVK